MKEMNRKEFFQKLSSPRLCIDRAKIVTRAEKEHETESAQIRRAHVFRALCNEMPAVIEDWQLIVGNFSSEPFAVSPIPDGCWRSIMEEMDTFGTREGDKYLLSEEDGKELREILPWWNGRSIQDKVMNSVPQEVKDLLDAGVMSSGYITCGSGNFPPDYTRILNRGLLDIKNEIEERRSKLDLTNPEDLPKKEYYDAALICCDGAMEFAMRYARKAKEMAEEEKDEERKQELLQISKNCERALRYPAQNIYEAMQSYWFAHILVYYDIAGGAGISAGRIDQYFYPFYKEEEREEVKKYITSLWYNYNEVLYFLTGTSAKIWAGHPISQQPTLAGVLEDGVTDASNELTLLMLEVDKELAIPQPDVAIMYHENIDPRVLELSCDDLVVSMKPKFFGYEAIKQQAIGRGMTDPKDWPDIVDIGCVGSGPTGRYWGNNGWGFFNYGKVLDLTLHNGVDIRTGKQISIKTGDPKDFETYDEFYDAFVKQFKYVHQYLIVLMNYIEKAHKAVNPQTYCSLLVDDCVARGKGPWDGGARYNCPGVELVATGSVADSLAAVKKLVYDEKKITMTVLLDALEHDFSDDYSEIQTMLKMEAPKYGNDEDYVDDIAKEIVKMYCEEHSNYKNPRGTNYCPSVASVSAHVGLGEKVAALPDGRNAWRPLSDGMSPSQGVCQNGPTAIIKSVAKIDQSITTDGNLLNMKFTKETLRNPETRQRFIMLLKVYLGKLDGYHMQFNFIDTQELIEAQKHPEDYPELIVRVAAYVAKFGQLPRELQNDIIERSMNIF